MVTITTLLSNIFAYQAYTISKTLSQWGRFFIELKIYSVINKLTGLSLLNKLNQNNQNINNSTAQDKPNKYNSFLDKVLDTSLLDCPKMSDET